MPVIMISQMMPAVEQFRVKRSNDTMNPTTPNIEPKPSTQRRKDVAAGSLKAILTSLLLGVAMEGPVLAQTTNAADDGTVLKQIIIFGRHSIRSAISTTNVLNRFSADPYPDHFGVPIGYLTTNGQQAAGLLGSYFHDYLLHEKLLTGSNNTDLARSYFHANTIERSYMTAVKFGAGLVPGVTVPIHTYAAGAADPVFDPLMAQVATVDPARALAEVLGLYGSGTNLASAYSSELSLISKVLYPPGTQPNTNAAQGSVDPTTLPITLVTNTPQGTNLPPYKTGDVINMGGLFAAGSAAAPSVMHYTDGSPTNEVGWGRFTLDTLSQQTRLATLGFSLAMRPPDLARMQASS